MKTPLSTYALLAGIAALAVAGTVFHYGLPTFATQAKDTDAAVFLSEQCGLKPEPLRGKSLERDDYEKIAALSAVMNNNSNVKLTDAMTQLRLFWWDKHGRADNDQAACARSDQMARDVDDQIWAIAGRAAKCGAAYGFVASGR